MSRCEGKLKVVLYCQIGAAIDMAEFSINGEFGAIKNTGLSPKEFDIVFICWKTPAKTYEWLNKNNFKYVDMEYDEGRGFLWNLYKGWNLGYEVGYKYADLICPIATDHAFYKDWLKNLLKYARENRIVNCKLIEPGAIQSLHTTKNFGHVIGGQFDHTSFTSFAGSISKDQLVFDDIQGLFHQNKGIGGSYGHRLDAMPFVVPVDVWKRFGPMLQTVNQHNVTGDVDFFDRCRIGGVEITKALDAISYHLGAAETKRNEKIGLYT